jgi:hypothetical protein
LGSWGNLVEGLRIQAGGEIDGMWASVDEPTGGQDPSDPARFDRCAYHNLRSWPTGIPVMAQQSVRVVPLAFGPYAPSSYVTAVVLGCPGGRVRVVEPGHWRTIDSPGHTRGTVDESPDFGFGGSALAVRHEVDAGSNSEKIVIWLGTAVDPPKRPAAYTEPSGQLQFDEVAAGAVVRMEWVPGAGSGFQNVGTPVVFHPTPTDRGGWGVLGLCETDLESAAFPGRQLIVGTASGDLFVLHAETMAVQHRVHVDGAIGFYNSIVATDLNNDGLEEVYVAGSKGLWRFTQQGETSTP